jgi:hypothetical protein
MKFYRNHYKVDGGISHSFHWFTSKAEALKDVKEHGERDEDDEIAEPIDITPTKAGILDALNRYAGHADNG